MKLKALENYYKLFSSFAYLQFQLPPLSCAFNVHLRTYSKARRSAAAAAAAAATPFAAAAARDAEVFRVSQDSWEEAEERLRWQMLRLEAGQVVFFGTPDTTPERVAAWIDGSEPWPQVRTMDLSKHSRSTLEVPPGAPGPMASEELADLARQELRTIAEEVGGPGRCCPPRHPPRHRHAF